MYKLLPRFPQYNDDLGSFWGRRRNHFRPIGRKQRRKSRSRTVYRAFTPDERAHLTRGERQEMGREMGIMLGRRVQVLSPIHMSWQEPIK